MKPRISLYKSSGFTLLEVLIALIVLSIGLLNMAALHIAGLRYNHSSYLMTQASYLTYEMADRMRANIQGVNNRSYNDPVSSPSDPGCIATGCSPNDIALTDMREWNSDIAAILPSGKGVVCLDSTPDDGTSEAPACSGSGTVFAIKIWWDNDRSGSPKQQLVTTFRP